MLSNLLASRILAEEITITGRTSRGVRALKLREGDVMADIDILRGATAAHEDPAVPAATTGTGTGTGTMLPVHLHGIAATPIDENSFVLMVTEKGYGKRTEIEEFKIQHRGGKGITAIKFKFKAGGGGRLSRLEGRDPAESDAVSCMRVCRPGDEMVLTTSKGTISRQRVDDLSIQSRTATGVLIQKIAKDDKIVNVDIVPPATIVLE
jgi:DNA gyrase subunit A